MNYRETVAFLYEQLPMFTRIGQKAYKKDIGNIKHLCEKLGQPERSFKSIHVAGTNGKGSTSHMLAAVLQSAGFKTGLFTSPHIHDFRERIRINGEMIPEAAVIEFVERIFPLEIEPSFFEITAAMAFDHFAAEQVDIAVIETGLGGRLDSTNILSPILSVITNIGMDHMDLLGDSLEKIASEKAGIIKKNTPVVIGETIAETESVFLNKAAAESAPLSLSDEHFKVKAGEYHFPKRWFSVLDKHSASEKKYALDLPGLYQEKNLATVLTALQQLRNLGLNISETAVEKGLSHVKTLTGIKGRWEQISKHPDIILDAGHNRDGIKALMTQLETEYPKTTKHIITGFVRDKEIADILRLFPGDALYYFTNAHLPRALPHGELQMLAENQGLKGKSYDDVNQALAEARRGAEPGDVILICGSFFILSELTAI
jgi:dihydrofolate synthase/folylpolyglutamate synthase